MEVLFLVCFKLIAFCFRSKEIMQTFDRRFEPLFKHKHYRHSTLQMEAHLDDIRHLAKRRLAAAPITREWTHVKLTELNPGHITEISGKDKTFPFDAEGKDKIPFIMISSVSMKVLIIDCRDTNTKSRKFLPTYLRKFLVEDSSRTFIGSQILGDYKELGIEHTEIK